MKRDLFDGPAHEDIDVPPLDIKTFLIALVAVFAALSWVIWEHL